MLRAPLHHLGDEHGRDDELGARVHSVLGVLNRHDSAHAGEHIGASARVLRDGVEAPGGGQGELRELETARDRRVHRGGARALDGRAQHRARLVLRKLAKDLVVRSRRLVVVARVGSGGVVAGSAGAGEDAAAGGAGDADAGAGAGARGGVRELLGIMALGLKELGQGESGLILRETKG